MIRTRTKDILISVVIVLLAFLYLTHYGKTYEHLDASKTRESVPSAGSRMNKKEAKLYANTIIYINLVFVILSILMIISCLCSMLMGTFTSDVKNLVHLVRK